MFSPSKPRELLPKDKFDLERATALVSTGYPTVAPILPDILGWLQDGNWPGVRVKVLRHYRQSCSDGTSCQS